MNFFTLYRDLNAIASITCTNSTLISTSVSIGTVDSDKKTTGLTVEGFSRDKDSVILDTHLSFVTMKNNSFYTALPFIPLPTIGEEREPAEREGKKRRRNCESSYY